MTKMDKTAFGMYNMACKATLDDTSTHIHKFGCCIGGKHLYKHSRIKNAPEAKQLWVLPVMPALLLGSFLCLLMALLLVPFRVLWLQPQVPVSTRTQKL